MNEMPLRIAQITDIHLFFDEKMELLGVNTRESFHAVIELLQAAPRFPDLVLLTGDLSQDRTEASYYYIADALKFLNVPIYCIPGNHDDGEMMKRVYPYGNISALKNIVLNQWNIILLNSQKVGAVEGYLARTELDFLKECLMRYPTHRAIIVFHHHPVFVGSKWLDNLWLTNADELWSVISQFPQVHTILFGHVHQEFEGVKNGIFYCSAPATCIQFKKNSEDFALDDIGPGYRWIELYSDGQLKTAIERVNHYVGKFDPNAKGY